MSGTDEPGQAGPSGPDGAADPAAAAEAADAPEATDVQPTAATPSPLPATPSPLPAPPPAPSAGAVGAHVATHAAPRTGTSRRWFLAGGVALLLGAGGGVAGAFARGRSRGHHQPRRPPGALVAAAATERALIADLDATTGGTPAVRTVITQVRADHAAHLRVLDGLIETYGTGATSSASASPTASPGTPRTARQLSAAERSAAVVAAKRAGRLDGRTATVLASIAACEATHADLLG